MNAFIERNGGKAGSRKQGKEATRAKVLEAAKAQLETVGFERTSIRGVAKEAGVATGTVLLHFPDKRELLHAALFDDLEHTWTEARDAKGRRALRRELVRIAKAFFDYYAQRPVLSRALLRESLFADPPWAARFAAQIADVHRHVAVLADRARARGEIDARTDSALLAAAFFSFYYFALLAWLQGGHGDPLGLFERLVDEHLRKGTGPR